MPEGRCTEYLGRLGGAIPTGQTTLVYQLEYHMKTTVKPRLARPSVAAAAILAFGLTFAGQAVRAEVPDSPSVPGQDMVLVSAKTVSELEQRIIYLEENVAALTESWQHINTHRLCVSDDSGAETCISKPQLDALLVHFAQAKMNAPAAEQDAAVATPAAPVETAATTPPAVQEPEWPADAGKEPITEPAIVVGKNSPSDQGSEVVETAAWPDNAGKEPVPEPAVVVGKNSASDQDGDVVEAIGWPADAGKEPVIQPAAVVGENSRSEPNNDITGTVKLADHDSSAGPSSGPAVVSYPKVEIYQEPADRTAD
jgi:hypothetical protein